MVELPAASGILELQAERRCDVAIDPLRLSAVDRVGQPGMATQSACMLTRTSSGTLGYLAGLFGPPWVFKGILGAFWMIGPHTHRPRGGVLHREGGRYVTPKAFLVRIFVLYYPQQVAPRPLATHNYVS